MDATHRMQSCLGEIVEHAANRNMIIYDSEAKPGHFSRRLVALLKTVNRRSTGQQIETIICNEEAFYSLMIECNLNSDQGYFNLFGVTIRFLRDIGVAQDFDQFKVGKPEGKTEFVVAIAKQDADSLDQSTRYLLGAY